MTRETLSASLGALVYAFQNWRRGRVHSRNNFFPQNLIIKKTWTITRRLRYTKVFVYFVDTFLILIHWIVIYLLDNRGLKYCILHLGFFKPLPTRGFLPLASQENLSCGGSWFQPSYLNHTLSRQNKRFRLRVFLSVTFALWMRQVPRANQTPFVVPIYLYLCNP